MAKKTEGAFDGVKKQIAATVGIVITTAGTLVVANMEKIFGTGETKVEDKKEIAKDSIKPKETKTVIIKEVPASKPKEEPKKKTETEQRKDEGFDW
jgi:ribosomal protein S24E